MVRLKLRQQLALLVSVLLLGVLAGFLWEWVTLTEQALEENYQIPYNQNNTSFNYYYNVLIPRIAIVLLVGSIYFLIDRVIVPALKRIRLTDTTEQIIMRILLAIFFFFAISYILALGVNVITYYAHPWFFNYGGFPFLSSMGYNDQPLTNWWKGFDRALSLLLIFTGLAYLREILSRWIERQGPKRAYRILVVNQVGAGFVVYLTVLSALSRTDLFRTDSFLTVFCIDIIPAVFAVFMFETYWLFPLKKDRSFFNVAVLPRLVAITFFCPLLFFFIGKNESPSDPFRFFPFCCALLLFVVTPIAWQIYRQRKDRILKLMGVEAELVKSKADLQFLRSQINPHFLFNALNTLYGSALRENATDTAKGIQLLGDMMRHMLHENVIDFISMSKEMEYLGNYISLQKIRIPPSPDILIEDNIAGQLCPHKIAPMLLIPFVENAFKHGISLQSPSWIRISLQCDERNIRFEVRNSVFPTSFADPERDSPGIGLKNVLDRLKIIYPDRHTIRIDAGEKEFVVQLALQP